MSQIQPLPGAAYLNRSHPLADRYRLGVLCHSLAIGAALVEPFSAARTVEGAPAWAGQSVVFDGSSALWWWDASPYTSASDLGPLTLLAGFRYTSTTPGYGSVMAAMGSSSGPFAANVTIGLRLDSGVGQAHCAIRDDSADSAAAQGTTTTLNDGLSHTVACVVLGRANPGMILYVDGVNEGTASTVGWGSFPLDRFSLGGFRNSSSSNLCAVALEYVHVWARALTQQELWSFRPAPYAMFTRPARRRIGAPGAAAGGIPTLVGARFGLAGARGLAA